MPDRRTTPRRRIGRRLLQLWLGLVLLAAVLALAAGLVLRGSGRAQRDGRAPLAGLTASVEIRFDDRAVPYVTAASARDAMAALGWLHANDRLFQMELTRRAAVGRLAELFGSRAVGYDRRVRELDFPALAERLLAGASAESRQLLEAYAAGVNAWLESRGDDLPPELRLLRHRPEPWRAIDSVGVTLVMARELSPVLDPPEQLHFRLLRAFGAERARDLIGDTDAFVFEEIAALAVAVPDDADADPPAAAGADGGVGSNNWVVGPARSAGGHALLANDPHLGLGLPNVWYQVSLDAPDYRASGMTLPGTPGVVLGRGPRLAWACTNLYVDDVDLFFEQFDETGQKVRRGDDWLPIVERQERIEVRGGEPVEITVRSTDRGPLLGADRRTRLPARSVAWTGQAGGDPLAAFVALARADSVAQVAAAIEPYVFPAQNLVAADAAGGILWTPLGRGPARYGWDGKLPAPGWRADVGWDGLVPAGEHPALIDPPAAAIVTANSDLPVELPAWFGSDFDTPYRLERIRELLLDRSDWSVEALAEVQLDTVSLWAREWVSAIGTGYDGDAGLAAAALAAWNGEMTERGAAALFALAERELARRVFGDESVGAGLPSLGSRWRMVRLLRGESAESWFDDVTTEPVEDRRTVVAAALAAAWQEGVQRWGSDVARWPYAEIHTLTLDHALSELPVIGRWFRRGPFPLPGSSTTVNALGGPWRGDVVDVTFGPSMRHLTDAADPSATRTILPGGQAGHPADPHYDDQLADWLAGRTRPVPWTPAAIEAATTTRLTLHP